jgi:predicted CopG family antitoxin
MPIAFATMCMYVLCMATKTISIDLEAYARLSAARLGPKDSFSQVIRRARWQEEARTCGALLASLKDMPVAEESVLRFLDTAQQQDIPPDDPRV